MSTPSAYSIGLGLKMKIFVCFFVQDTSRQATELGLSFCRSNLVPQRFVSTTLEVIHHCFGHVNSPQLLDAMFSIATSLKSL